MVAEPASQTKARERRDTANPGTTYYGSERIGTPSRLGRFPCIPMKWRMNVDREHVKGAADKVKGAIKDTAGKMTGDKKLQAEGKVDKAKGSAHKVAGDVKDAVRNASDD